MFSKSDISRDAYQLFGPQGKCGYDWWWHSFTAYNKKTGKARPFFIEFFVCNPKLGGRLPVFGQSLENMKRGIKPSYLMVKAGTWGEDGCQLHRFFGIKEADISSKVPYSVSADDCFAGEKALKGSVKISEEESKNHPEWMCDSGEITWDLKVKKVIPFNVGYGAGKLFRTLQLFEMFWHVEGMKTLYQGVITYNGEEYEVRPQDCYGYADKNWGKDFTSPWVWLSSNNLTSMRTGKKLRNSVFDIGGGRPKVGPIALPRQLLSAFYYEGRNYEFNFSKFWTVTRTKFDCYETDTQIVWHIEQKALNNKMVTDITCEKKDMLFVNYEAPNGLKKHNRLWNGGNGKGSVKLYHAGRLVDEVICENVGCEYGEYDC